MTSSDPFSLAGKRGLIFGVANDKSIGWGVARRAFLSGAELGYSYQSEALKKRVQPLAEQTRSNLLLECDVTDEAALDRLFERVEQEWGTLDFVVHSLAFANKDELKGRYINTTLNNFLLSMQISCYSLTAIARRAEKLMKNGGSILTMTYYGASKVMPHYNVMGVAKAALEASVKYLAVDMGAQNIRVNAISAGPIRTLASAGIGDFHYILKWNELNAPLKRTVSIDEVGNASAFLLSPASSGMTGQIIYVDAGYNVIGMKAVDAPDISLVEK